MTGPAPVVHEYVWLPENTWRHPDVLDIAVLRRVPLQVRIGPLLPRQSIVNLEIRSDEGAKFVTEIEQDNSVLDLLLLQSKEILPKSLFFL